MPLLKRVRVLAAKVEAVPGTAETLTNTEAAFNVFDAEMQPEIEFFERPQQGSFVHLKGALGARGATCTFRTEIYGGADASTTPGWTTFLRGCGMVENAGEFTFVPGTVGNTTNDQRTLTLGLYENGKRKRMRGCMGNFVLNFPTGRPAFIEWTFSGIWMEPDDAALLVPSYPSQMPMRAASISNTTGATIARTSDNAAWNACFENMTIDAGNEVVLRPCVNPADGSGFTTALITNRKTTGEFNPESTLVNTKNLYNEWLTYGTHTLNYRIGDGVSEFNAQLDSFQIENLQEGDRENMQIDTVSFTQTTNSLIIQTGAAL